jgi:hypothetical protein
LDYANKIKDRELRNAYINDFKGKWFQKKAVAKPAAHFTADPKYTYELILLMTILYYPIILDSGIVDMDLYY